MMEDLGLGAVSAAVGAIYRDEDLGDWGWGPQEQEVLVGDAVG